MARQIRVPDVGIEGCHGQRDGASVEPFPDSRADQCAAPVMRIFARGLSTQTKRMGRGADHEEVYRYLLQCRGVLDRTELQVDVLFGESLTNCLGYIFGVAPRGFINDQCWHEVLLLRCQSDLGWTTNVRR